jgi:hypothetical protein
LDLPRTEELGGFVRTAGDNLAKSCVNCWSNGLEDYSHLLDECRLKPFELRSGEWREWRKTLRFPVGCCFYCGCPQNVCPDCICDCGLQFSLMLRHRNLAKSFKFMNILVTRPVTGFQCSNLLRFLSFTVRF